MGILKAMQTAGTSPHLAISPLSCHVHWHTHKNTASPHTRVHTQLAGSPLVLLGKLSPGEHGRPLSGGGWVVSGENKKGWTSVIFLPWWDQEARPLPSQSHTLNKPGISVGTLTGQLQSHPGSLKTKTYPKHDIKLSPPPSSGPLLFLPGWDQPPKGTGTDQEGEVGLSGPLSV